MGGGAEGISGGWVEPSVKISGKTYRNWTITLESESTEGATFHET